MPEAFSNEAYKTEIINGRKIIMMSPPFSNHNVVKGNIYRKGRKTPPLVGGDVSPEPKALHSKNISEFP